MHYIELHYTKSLDTHSSILSAERMPANLTPQYHKAEQAYRAASTPHEELECLEIMLQEIPKHKGTDKLQADLKQKISRLKKEVSEAKTGGKRPGFRLPRQGAGRVVLIGPPNTGKSQLLASLTRAHPEVANYPFTTREPLPGMMPWEDIAVQLVDTPAITGDTYPPEVQSLIRGAELAVLLVDLGSDDGGQDLADLLSIVQASRTRLARDTHLDEDDIGVSYTGTILAFNKIDLPEGADRLQFFEDFFEVDLERAMISAATGAGLDSLKETLVRRLDVVRVYTKMPNKKEADFEKPYTLTRGGTIADLARLIHNDLAERLKFARVWGSTVHDATVVKGDYVLHDKDIVEIHS